MTNINHLHNIPYSLIADQAEGNISAEGLEQLELWKNTSPEHLKKYNELLLLEDQLRLLALSKHIDPQKAWENFAPSLENTTQQSPKSSVRKLTTYYKWAAAAAIVLSILYFYKPEFFTGIKTIRTAKNEYQKVILPDGSEINMNENTTLSYNSWLFLKNRKVNLQKGEAFFEVKHQQAHPFLVKMDEVNVRDIGTSFNLKIEQEQIVVIVNSGKVALEANSSKVDSVTSKSLLLSEKDKGIFNRKTKTLSSQKNTWLNYKSWCDHKLQFIQTPLEEVARDLEDAFGKAVILQDADLKNRKLSAYFDQQSEEEIIRIIAASLQLQVTKKDDTFVLYK